MVLDANNIVRLLLQDLLHIPYYYKLLIGQKYINHNER